MTEEPLEATCPECGAKTTLSPYGTFSICTLCPWQNTGEKTTLRVAMERIPHSDTIMAPVLVVHRAKPDNPSIKFSHLRFLHPDTPVTIDGTRILDMDGKLICEVSR